MPYMNGDSDRLPINKLRNYPETSYSSNILYSLSKDDSKKFTHFKCFGLILRLYDKPFAVETQNLHVLKYRKNAWNELQIVTCEVTNL